MSRIPFDLKKALTGESVVTRAGIAVLELYHFAGKGTHYPLHVRLEGYTSIYNYDGEGCYYIAESSKHDLFMAPKKRYVNIYGSKAGGNTYSSRAYANNGACGGRTACVEYTEGEGL